MIFIFLPRSFQSMLFIFSRCEPGLDEHKQQWRGGFKISGRANVGFGALEASVDTGTPPSYHVKQNTPVIENIYTHLTKYLYFTKLKY